MKPLLALLVAGSFLSAGLWSAEDEVELKKEEVPAAVLETMQKAAGGAVLGEFEKETKKGVVVFTATFTKDKQEMEVTVDPQGKLISVEAEDDEDGDKDEKKDGKDEKGEKGEKDGKDKHPAK